MIFHASSSHCMRRVVIMITTKAFHKINVISWITQVFWWALTYGLIDRDICMMPQLSNKLCLSIPYMYLKQIHVDSMLLWFCFVMYCRRHKRTTVVRTTVTHSTAPHIPFFLFLPCFDLWSITEQRQQHGIYMLIVFYNIASEFV